MSGSSLMKMEIKQVKWKCVMRSDEGSWMMSCLIKVGSVCVLRSLYICNKIKGRLAEAISSFSTCILKRRVSTFGGKRSKRRCWNKRERISLSGAHAKFENFNLYIYNDARRSAVY
jgi:hypothetical protein